jgi:PAS domain S-box-containing protein
MMIHMGKSKSELMKALLKLQQDYDSLNMSYLEKIDKHKRLEAAFQESEARFHILFENSLTATSMASPEGKLLQINYAYARMYGYDKPEEMLAEISNVKQLYARQEDRKEVLKKLHKNGFLEAQEVEVIRRDGSRFPVLVSACEIRDSKGKLLYNQSAHLDLTELKKNKEKIQATSLYARNLFEASLDPLITIDVKGKITDANLTMEHVTGIKREKLIGSNFANYFTEPDKARRGFRTIFSRGLVKNFPMTILHNSGRTIHVLFNASPFRNESGNVQGVFAAARDISDRIKMEEELRNSKELLEKLNHHLNEIRENERAIISREIHDQIGQSLTALKLDMKWLYRFINANPEAVLKFDSIIELISQTIKDVQRISSDLRPGILDDLGLVSAIDWYCDEFEKRTGIQCKFNFDKSDYRGSKTDITFFRILQETLTNVIRHSKASSVNIKLYKSLKGITMTIQDNGIGVPEEKIKSNKSLGFMIMHERVRQFNGKVDISSKKGEGTKLTIFIPS